MSTFLDAAAFLAVADAKGDMNEAAAASAAKTKRELQMATLMDTAQKAQATAMNEGCTSFTVLVGEMETEKKGGIQECVLAAFLAAMDKHGYEGFHAGGPFDPIKMTFTPNPSIRGDRAKMKMQQGAAAAAASAQSS